VLQLRVREVNTYLAPLGPELATIDRRKETHRHLPALVFRLGTPESMAHLDEMGFDSSMSVSNKPASTGRKGSKKVRTGCITCK
jgi:hypothetical protein